MVIGVNSVVCLDCALSQLEDEDSVSVQMDLLLRLRDGVLGRLGEGRRRGSCGRSAGA